MADPRLRAALEACYQALENGEEPDLDSLCAGDPALREHVTKLLARERELLQACRAPSHLPTQPMPRQIGEFTLIEPLGTGGMSHVYRARQEPLGREVALKVLREDVTQSTTGRLRFHREASITAALDHPNIVPVYAAGEADGHVYLAMKLLRGRPLDRCDLPLEPRRVAKYGVEIATALQAAHDIGVVHRDVKPANVMIERDIAIVVDFGLSSFRHSAGAITRSDTTPGTLIYLAPEMVRRRSSGLDPRVDVYGVGATLYEALAGRPPFDGSNAVHALFQILNQDPPPLGLKGRDRDLETIVLRAMEKSPQRRFQTAAELAEDLQRYRDGLPIRARAIGLWERGVRMVARHRTTAALSAICGALLLGLTLLLWSGARRRQAEFDAGTAAIAAQIAIGDVAAADRGVAALVGAFGESAHTRRLQAEAACERDVQALIAILQSPTTHQEPRALRTLVQRLIAAGNTPARSARTDAALAIASRLLADDPVTHLPLQESTRETLPRTAAALGAWSRHRPPSGVLMPPRQSPEALDHLFAALTLRLAGEQGAAIEDELRLAAAHGPAADAIQYSLAWALEADEQVRSAYDCCARIVDSPVYGGLALLHCARLAAGRNDAANAQRLLQRAIAANATTPHLRDLTLLSELEVLLALDIDEFHRRWQAAAPIAENLARYWLLAGYATLDQTDQPLPAAIAEAARTQFRRGLACNPDIASRRNLELALLQLDWMCSPAILSFDPLPATPVHDPERRRLIDLAERATRFITGDLGAGAPAEARADAALVASSAWRAIGDRLRSWQVLEDSCREHAASATLARFAMLTGYRVATVHLAEPGHDDDADRGPPLDEAAGKGVARAQQVLADRRAFDSHTLGEARQGLFLCAFHLGDAEIGLPMALQLRRDISLNPAIHELAALAIADGGLHLDRLLASATEPAPAALPRLLLGACNALRRTRADGDLATQELHAVLQRWRLQPRLAATMGIADPMWVELWRQVAELEAKESVHSPR